MDIVHVPAGWLNDDAARHAREVLLTPENMYKTLSDHGRLHSRLHGSMRAEDFYGKVTIYAAGRSKEISNLREVAFKGLGVTYALVGVGKDAAEIKLEEYIYKCIGLPGKYKIYNFVFRDFTYFERLLQMLRSNPFHRVCCYSNEASHRNSGANKALVDLMFNWRVVVVDEEYLPTHRSEKTSLTLKAYLRSTKKILEKLRHNPFYRVCVYSDDASHRNSDINKNLVDLMFD